MKSLAMVYVRKSATSRMAAAREKTAAKENDAAVSARLRVTWKRSQSLRLLGLSHLRAAVAQGEETSGG